MFRLADLLHRSHCLWLVMALGACSSESPLEGFTYSPTDKVDVYVEGPVGLCAGEVDEYDNFVRTLEELFGAPSDDRIPARIYLGPAHEACDGASGCFFGGEIDSGWSAMRHELVHAVAARRGPVTTFFSEVVAESLSGKPAHLGTKSVLEESTKGLREVSVRTAGHFGRWMLDRFSAEVFRDLHDGLTFEEAVGMSLEEAVAVYEADAPWFYPWVMSCRGPVVMPDAMGSVSVAAELDCSSVDTFRHGSIGNWMTTYRTLRITEEGLYRFELTSGDLISLIGCEPDIIEEPRVDSWSGDVPNETRIPDGHLFAMPDDPLEAFMIPGDYEVQVRAGREDLVATAGFVMTRIE